MRTMFFTTIIAASLFANASYGNNQIEDEAPLKVTVLKDGRKILSKDGLTAYTFDNDQGSVSSCYDACANAWPPILAQEGDVLGEEIGLTTRKDGSQQLTYLGAPVYFFAGDAVEGEINGDGLGGVWHIILE